MSLWLLCEGNGIYYFFLKHFNSLEFDCLYRPLVTDCSHQILFSLLETLSFGSLYVGFVNVKKQSSHYVRFTLKIAETSAKTCWLNFRVLCFFLNVQCHKISIPTTEGIGISWGWGVL